ncbi:MAG TPA: DUF5655 domain-containing protein [Pseudonocardiaceae bacterium]|jgi:hypothetical protein|nr:DUF5655 domain-containing protein [Pseudonocardiaceae bacterium]
MTETVDWTVADHLRGRPENAVAMYQKFVELVGSCGPFAFSPSKTIITFKGTRRGFAGARPTASGLLIGYLDLQRVVTGPQINSAAPYTRRLFTHQFRISAFDQFDDAFAGWVMESYLVGQGAHLNSPLPA